MSSSRNFILLVAFGNIPSMLESSSQASVASASPLESLSSPPSQQDKWSPTVPSLPVGSTVPSDHRKLFADRVHRPYSEPCTAALFNLVTELIRRRRDCAVHQLEGIVAPSHSDAPSNTYAAAAPLKWWKLPTKLLAGSNEDQGTLFLSKIRRFAASLPREVCGALLASLLLSCPSFKIYPHRRT